MKVLIAASASGGHILPALSVARELKKKSPPVQILFLTEKNKISSQILSDSEFEVAWLEFKSKGAFSLQTSSSIIKLLLFCFQIIGIVKKFSPDYIAGFGGYVSIIPIVGGRLFGIKTIIHEQNVSLGKANRFLGSFSHTLAVSFSTTKERNKSFKIAKKIVYTGLPLRENLRQNNREEASRFFEFNPQVLTILVLGGSSGSRAINQSFISSVENLDNREPFQIIHISGFDEEKKIKSFYQNQSNLRVKVFPFLKDMSLAYSVADLCICRSGAGTIYELSLFKIPAILVPYPYATAHQFENARFLEEAKAAIVLKENNLNHSLRENLSSILSDRRILATMRGNFPSGLYFDGAPRLAEIILKNYENN